MATIATTLRAACRHSRRRVTSSNANVHLRVRGGRRPFGTVVRNVDDCNDNSYVSIGDVRVDDPPRGSGSPHLVPRPPSRLTLRSDVNASLPPCHLSHLRWMLQKDLVLRQDFLLIGPPSTARDRRHLLLLYAHLLGREVEWMSITRDTSESDLKQRKEVTGDATRYVDQAPVRAASAGRLLVLDGLEKAERNVLPTLNNLLENREMPLDDGTTLVSPDHAAATREESRESLGVAPVHRDFRVAALASVADGEGATLDPPLRSRFQARLASSVDVGDMLLPVSAALSNGEGVSARTLREVVQMAGEVAPGGGASLEAIRDAVRYLERQRGSVTPRAALDAHGVNLTGDMIEVEDLASPLRLDRASRKGNLPDFVDTDTTRAVQDMIAAGLHDNRAVAVVGPKGCYKSTVARNLAHILNKKCELLSLHPDMTARDLLMTRGTCQETGDTIWIETPLTRAARMGNWVILDGIDKLRPDTLSSLALLMEQGTVVSPDGSQFHASEEFKCIAIAHPPTDQSSSWITPEIRPMFHWIEATPLTIDEFRLTLSKMFPNMKRKVLDKILALQEKLDNVTVDDVAGKASLQLTMRKIKHVCKRVEQRPSELADIIHNTLMTSFLPDWEQNIVNKCLSECGIVASGGGSDLPHETMESILEACRRTPSNPLLVPNPRYEENPGQARVKMDILEAHHVGEKALLITGYQGVGKNKIVDRLLHQMNCEREYLQLHRDTTINSLMVVPSVENGRVVYHDSPLVRAAIHGRILVLDEADKAPVEVVALLKGLIEDGQLSLPDGRMLCHRASSSDPDVISIHEDFSIWTLTNPAGYPFHGNDLSREMADVFSCHIVPPMDTESHKRILESYGDSVSSDVIDKIVSVWEDLRRAHQIGSMTYPFSVRESVNVVKHLNAFPDDGLEDAVDNVIAFDLLDKGLSRHLDGIFGSHGIHLMMVDEHSSTTKTKLGGGEGGVSTPKTRASNPKHGKVDPDNTPHVGK